MAQNWQRCSEAGLRVIGSAWPGTGAQAMRSLGEVSTQQAGKLRATGAAHPLKGLAVALVAPSAHWAAGPWPWCAAEPLCLP